jgi:hypothetical protein
VLEVCTCKAICPCWVGLDPDGGDCQGTIAWYIDHGTIQGVDVSDRGLAVVAHIPGNVLAGNWKAVLYVDDLCTDEQQQAILNVFTAQLGGAIADLAALIGEVVTVERAPFTSTIESGAGILRIGDAVEAELSRSRAPLGDSPRCTTPCSARSPAPPPTRARPASTAAWDGCSADPTWRSRGTTRSRAHFGSRPDMAVPTLATRARHDPGTTVWVIAGICWVAMAWLAVSGGDELGHHDVVLTQSDWPWAARIGAFFATWLVMIGAMMLPTVVPMVRLFVPVSARSPRPAAARAAFFGAYVGVWGHVRPARPARRRRRAHPGRPLVLASRPSRAGAGLDVGARGRIPVHPSQERMPDRLPKPREFSAPALPARPCGRLAARRAPRAVVPGLLLGADARHVRHRGRQPGLDAGARRRDGAGEDQPLGCAARRPGRHRIARGRTRHRGAGSDPDRRPIVNVNVLLLAHEGHSHNPSVGLIALLIVSAVLAVVLLLRLVAQRHHGSSSDR